MPDSDVRVHVGQGTARGGLTVFPVWTDAAEAPVDYATGTDAALEVSERAGALAVDELVVTNHGPVPALLVAGELLEGGLQHRAVATTVLVPPGRGAVVPVVCVEQGRWHGGSTHGRRARHAPAAVRAQLHGQRVQDRVWRSVSRYEAVCGPSDTGSLVERMNQADGSVRSIVEGLEPLPGQRGLLVGLGGRPVRLDVFDSVAALHAHWAGLLGAAALESLRAAQVRTPAARARSFAEAVQRADLVMAAPAGLARSYTSRRRLTVDAVRWRHRTLHLSATDLVLLEA